MEDGQSFSVSLAGDASRNGEKSREVRLDFRAGWCVRAHVVVSPSRAKSWAGLVSVHKPITQAFYSSALIQTKGFAPFFWVKFSARPGDGQGNNPGSKPRTQSIRSELGTPEREGVGSRIRIQAGLTYADRESRPALPLSVGGFRRITLGARVRNVSSIFHLRVLPGA